MPDLPEFFFHRGAIRCRELGRFSTNQLRQFAEMNARVKCVHEVVGSDTNWTCTAFARQTSESETI